MLGNSLATNESAVWALTYGQHLDVPRGIDEVSWCLGHFWWDLCVNSALALDVMEKELQKSLWIWLITQQKSQHALLKSNYVAKATASKSCIMILQKTELVLVWLFLFTSLTSLDRPCSQDLIHNQFVLCDIPIDDRDFCEKIASCAGWKILLLPIQRESPHWT